MNTQLAERLMTRIEDYRDREMEERIQRILEFLLFGNGGGRFAVQTKDGRYVDPLNDEQVGYIHEGETSAQWRERVNGYLAESADRERLAIFTRDIAVLDEEQRTKILDENSNSFARGRLEWFKGLSLAECDILSDQHSATIYFHLSGEHPIPGIRSNEAVISNYRDAQNKDLEAEAAPAFTPSLAG